MGISKEGHEKDSYAPGVELLGKQTIFAEGCRGSITQKLYANKHFNLYANAQAQTYALGIKEVWIVDPAKHQPGLVLHTGGWPLQSDSFGGSFMYHDVENRVYVGFVVGLDYSNPYLSIYDEFQRFKTHPAIKPTFEGGECIAYGARTITEGGLQCLPKLTMPGALLAGDNAGTLVAARIKGVHTAMKAGMLAAEAIMNKIEAVQTSQTGIELTNYTDLFKESWLYKEMYKYRNFRPAVNNYGFYIGSCIIAFDQFIARGKLPFTMKFAHEGDNHSLKLASQSKKIEYPKYDNKITFDLLTNLIRSGTSHEEDQPCHLVIKDMKGMLHDNYEKYAGPEGRFCPAKVYEWLDDEHGKPYLQLSPANCLHCKACSIKDYGQRIEWRVPQGGGGPQYAEL
jgi:electron-transferring-flavoprotein dehydrogenase